MVLGIQIVGTFFGLFMIYFTYLNFKKKVLTTKELSVWVALWVLFIGASLFPNLLDFFVAKLSLTRAMDLLIVAGFMTLILMFFYTYILVRINQKKLEEIVRKVAKERAK
jgi:hypothetical protein